MSTFFYTIILLKYTNVLFCPLVNAFPQVNPTNQQVINENINFKQKYIGTVFSPYVKHRWANGSVPKWHEYSTEEVSTLLNLISTKFRHISTYGMGVERPDASWQEGLPVGWTAMATAEHNSKSESYRKLSLSLGVWHNEDPDLTNREFINSFEASQAANSHFPKTVWGVAISSFGYMGYRSWNDTLDFIRTYRDKAHEIELALGARIEICDQIIPKRKPEDVYNEGLHSAVTRNVAPIVLSDIQKIARISDFLICNTFPPASMVSNGTQFAAEDLIVQFLATLKGLKAENPGINVWFETGWPSAGISYSGSSNTKKNLRTFWKAVTELARKEKLQLYMFTAFDEPWKTSNSKPKSDPQGPNGAESHYGWWEFTDKSNMNFSAFQEKMPEPEIEPEVPVTDGLSAGATAVLVVCILLLMVPIILFLVWRLHKARKTIERLSEKDIKEFMEGIQGKGDTGDPALHLPYDQSYELSKTDFVIDESEVLGSGAFGVVHLGKINGIEGPVAFKRPNRDISVSQLKNLLSEIKIMIYIGKHENVVVLLGAYTEHIRDGIVYIASECCPRGSLEAHLRSIPRSFTSIAYENIRPIEESGVSKPEKDRYVNTDRKPIEITTDMPVLSLYKWSYQIASGMEYLASKKVIHADLATRNVLLTQDGTAKISDFGLSRRLYEYTQYVKCSQEPLPWRWMAIESLRKLEFSTTSDVWSFGVTIWEIFSLGDMPFPGLSWEIGFVQELEHGLRMQKPKYATAEIYERMLDCWNLEPELRPKFQSLKEFFELLLSQEQKLKG